MVLNIVLYQGIQIKTTRHYYHICTSMVKIKRTNNSKYWQGCGALELKYKAGQSIDEYNHLRKLYYF